MSQFAGHNLQHVPSPTWKISVASAHHKGLSLAQGDRFWVRHFCLVGAELWKMSVTDATRADVLGVHVIKLSEIHCSELELHGGNT